MILLLVLARVGNGVQVQAAGAAGVLILLAAEGQRATHAVQQIRPIAMTALHALVLAHNGAGLIVVFPARPVLQLLLGIVLPSQRALVPEATGALALREAPGVAALPAPCVKQQVSGIVTRSLHALVPAATGVNLPAVTVIVLRGRARLVQVLLRGTVIRNQPAVQLEPSGASLPAGHIRAVQAVIVLLLVPRVQIPRLGIVMTSLRALLPGQTGALARAAMAGVLLQPALHAVFLLRETVMTSQPVRLPARSGAAVLPAMAAGVLALVQLARLLLPGIVMIRHRALLLAQTGALVPAA